MNAKHLLLAATAAFVASNFMGCKEKEKEDDFDYTFENCVKSVSSMEINDGDTIRSKTIYLKSSSVIIKDGIKNVKGKCLLYVGTSKDKMELLSNGEIELQPFAKYYVESTPFIVHDGDTVFGEKQEINFYSIPKHELALTADYGDGEIAANIHWKLQYYYENEDTKGYGRMSDNPLSPYFYYNDQYIEHKYYQYTGALSPISIRLVTNTDTTYNKNSIEFPSNVDSCYITQGGTREKPDYPAYIYRYWNDGKTLRYYDPVIYDFCFNINIPLGDGEYNIKDTIRSILMDKSQCVCDYEFNIYRTTKIGNKIWTIDDYRGSTFSTVAGNWHGKSVDFYGCNEYLYNTVVTGYGDGGYIKGYHESNEDDWRDLMMCLGINVSDTFDLGEQECLKIENTDTSMCHYFASSGAVQELFSAYGWTDSNGNLIESYQGFFNAVPKGAYYLTKYFGQGKYALFRCKGKGGLDAFIISKDYCGIAIGKAWHVYGNIRYVKD
ncbi:MAG: hypothetical protein IKO46_05195 [Salinivirgaceae bacterium]|nr:hypothetical protein [Salinivirgaceae bacterium]